MTTTNDAPAPAPSGGGVREAIAKIIDPHSFVPYAPTGAADDVVFAQMVEDSLQDAYRKADRILSALASDASPRGKLPELPDDDHDFTPDLARKIISGYQRLLRAHPAPATVESVRALPYLIHLARQRWDRNWSYTLEELADRWLAGQFHTDAAEADAKAAALAPATEGRKG